MTLVAVSNHGGGIARHIGLVRSAVDIELVDLPESISLPDKVRALRASLAAHDGDLLVTHGVAAGLAARHRGRRLRRLRHVEVWHADPFVLTPRRRPVYTALARTGLAPDLQVFVAHWLQPSYRDARTKKVMVLANTVPQDQVATDAEVRANRVVYMGRLSPEKGYLDLLAAWPRDATTNEWSLDVFGEGPLAGTPVPPGVSLRGHTDEPLAELAAAAFAVVPSWTEASPYVAVEALAVGTPLVATRTGDMPELLAADCGWLVQPRDVAGLRSALTQAQASTPYERAAAGRRGQEWLRRERPFDAWCARVRDIYR